MKRITLHVKKQKGTAHKLVRFPMTRPTRIKESGKIYSRKRLVKEE